MKRPSLTLYYQPVKSARIKYNRQVLVYIILQTYLKALILYNARQIYFVECVIKIKHMLSVIHYTKCGAVCFQFTHFSCDDWENIYTLSYYHFQIGSMNYYPLFKVNSCNNCIAVCFSIFYKWNYKGFVSDALILYIHMVRVWNWQYIGIHKSTDTDSFCVYSIHSL